MPLGHCEVISGIRATAGGVQGTGRPRAGRAMDPSALSSSIMYPTPGCRLMDPLPAHRSAS
jgi:hypothetical protein